MHPRFVLLLLSGVLSLCALPSAFAATWYCTPGGGGTACTQASPCSLNTGLGKVAAGDTLYLRGGTYNQRISWQDVTLPKGTSWSSPATVSGYPGETVIVNGQLDIGPNAAPNTMYLIIRDLIAQDYGVWVGANRVRLQNIESRNSPGNSLQVGGDFNEFLNLKLHDNPRSTRSHGIYMWGSDNLIDHCEVWGHTGLGMQIYGGGADNDVERNIVRNNIIYDNGHGGQNSNGILLADGVDNIAYNNVVYNNIGGSLGIIVDYGCINCKVYNNTIVGNSNAGLAVGGGSHKGSVSTGTIFRNNIVINNAGGAGNAQVNLASGTTATFSNNLCSAAGTGCALVGSATQTFVNASASPPNYKLTSTSPAKNAGTTLSAVPTDYAGVTRPQGSAYDIGAYEFVEGGGGTPTPPSGNPLFVATTGNDANTCAQAEGTHTVASSAPKQTIASALTCMTVPGKTMYLRTGTYNEVIDTGTAPITGGSSWATATKIAAWQSETVTLRPPADQVAVFFRNSESWIIVEKLHLDCDSVSGTNGAAVYPGTHHIRFSAVEIANCFFEGLYIQDADNVEVLGGRIHHQTNNSGIVLVGVVENFLLQGVEIDNNGQSALAANATNGNNTNMIVDRNTLHHNGVAASYPTIDIGPGTGALVKNNVIYRNYWGVRMLGSTGTDLFNNTVVNGTAGITCDTSTGVEIKNNIVFGNSTSAITDNCTSTLLTNVVGDPTFTNSAGDVYTLAAGSIAFNTGTTLAGVTTDYAGVARPQFGTYDVGAYESTVDLGTGGGPPTPDVTILAPMRLWNTFLF